MNIKIICALIAFCCASVSTAGLAYFRHPIPLGFSAASQIVLLLLIAKLSPSARQPKHENASELEAAILDYMNDHNANYAISLTGEWGSGKTWYCDNALKPFLGRKGYSLCRISLFGLADAKEVSSKIAAGLLFLDESSTNKAVKRVKQLLHRFAPQASKAIGAASGVPISLDPVAVLGVLPRKNCLVVLDDLERTRFENDADALFGIVNELCENQERKVLLISNGYPLSAHDEEQLEKVVWRRYTYHPKIADLYDSVLSGPGQIPDTLGDLDVRKAVINGIESSGVINTRAMIKARPSLAVIATSPAIHDAAIDKSEKQRTLSEAVRLAILVASSSIVKTKDIEDRTKRREAMVRQEDYEYFRTVLKPIQSGQIVDERAMSEALRLFIEEQHNRSSLDIEISTLLSQLGLLREMDDNEAARIVTDLAKCIRTGEVKVSYMKEVYKANKTLRDIGFDEALPDDEIKKSFYEAIDRDPFTARAALNGKYTMWLDTGEERDPFLDDLVERANNQAIKRAIAANDRRKGCPIPASEIISASREYMKRGMDPIVPIAFSANLVAEVFESSNGKSQEDLILFFKGEYSQRSYPFEKGTKESRKWLEEITVALRNRETKGKLNNWRKEQFIKELNSIIKTIDTQQNP